MGYSRLEPGRELEVREYISFQRGRDGFCELIECSVDELLERKAESTLTCLLRYAHQSRQSIKTAFPSTDS